MASKYSAYTAQCGIMIDYIYHILPWFSDDRSVRIIGLSEPNTVRQVTSRIMRKKPQLCSGLSIETATGGRYYFQIGGLAITTVSSLVLNAVIDRHSLHLNV